LSDWLQDIHGLADGELGPEEKARAAEELLKNPKAQAEYQWTLYLKETLRNRCQNVKDEECWSASVRRLNEIDRTKRTERFVGRYSWALCALLLATILVGGALDRFGLNKGVSSSNMASLFSLTPRNVHPGEARDLVKNTIGNAPFAVESNGTTLTSVATGRVGQFQAAKLAFRDASGPFLLVVVKDANGFEGIEGLQESAAYSLGRINGRPCITWKEGGYALLLVADRQESELLKLADGIRLGTR